MDAGREREATAALTSYGADPAIDDGDEDYEQNEDHDDDEDDEEDDDDDQDDSGPEAEMKFNYEKQDKYDLHGTGSFFSN